MYVLDFMEFKGCLIPMKNLSGLKMRLSLPLIIEVSTKPNLDEKKKWDFHTSDLENLHHHTN